MSYSNGKISKVAGLMTASTGLAVLAGWVFNIPVLKSVIPGLVSMKFNTAICFILSGIALYLLNNKKNNPFRKGIIIFFAFTVMATGLLTLSEYLFNYNEGIDEFIWKEGPGTAATLFAGRMSQISALNFTLSGIILLLLLKKGKYKWIIQLLFLVLLTLSLLTLFIYLFGIGFSISIPMIDATALHTALLFILLSFGFLYCSTISKARLNFQKKIFGVFILVAILLGMMFYIYDKNQERSVNTTRLVEHTYDVLSKAEKLKAQANQMGSVIETFSPSDFEANLAILDNEADSMEDILYDLKKMTGDNNSQQQRIDTLGLLIRGNISYWETLRNDDSAKIHSDLFFRNKITSMIAEVQLKVADIVQAESRLLVKRKAENENIIHNASRIITLFQIITFLLLVIAVIVILNNTRRRNKTEEENKRLNDTLEKRVEEKTGEVIKKEQQYRFLLQNMREGIQVISYDWRYLFVNNSVVDQAKYSNEELEGYTMMEKYPGIENTELFKVLKRCMEERNPEIIENEFTFPDQTKGYFELSIQPVPEGLFILSIDITKRKKAEEKLKEYAEELHTSNIELERFAYIASHDLQEPLRMVSSFLTLLEKRIEGQLDETGKQFIYFAVDGASRMKTLIQDLLLYSRVGTNKEDFTPVDLNEIIQYTKRVLEEDIEGTGADIMVGSLPVITGNKTLIGQLFVNLVSNALKYRGDKKPEIEIGCTAENNKWVFHIKDNGIGIDPKYFDKIFIIFQRLHNKGEYSGTGIGLAICRKIIEIHKGKIRVESEPGKGSTFYFSIPK